jgi:hypothetical protein
MRRLLEAFIDPEILQRRMLPALPASLASPAYATPAPSPALRNLQRPHAMAQQEPELPIPNVLTEMHEDPKQLDPGLASNQKECGHARTVWCACTKFRDYYDSEHDGPHPDPVSN